MSLIMINPTPTHIGLYSHCRWLEAQNFRFWKKRDSTISVAKTKALISCAVLPSYCAADLRLSFCM